MANFEIKDINGNTDNLNLVFNTLGSNTWNVIGGNASILPTNNGVWDCNGLTNELFIRDNSGKEILYIPHINLTVSLTNPFENLNPGNFGDGILSRGSTEQGLITWTFISQ